MSKEKNVWAFWAVVVGGAAFLLAFLLSRISSDLSGTMNTIAKVCSLIAWVLVALYGWGIAQRRTTVWKVVYIVCFAAILICGGLLFFI